eukprot:2168003-Prymnesium_polylepis.1
MPSGVREKEALLEQIAERTAQGTTLASRRVPSYLTNGGRYSVRGTTRGVVVEFLPLRERRSVCVRTRVLTGYEDAIPILVV